MPEGTRVGLRSKPCTVYGPPAPRSCLALQEKGWEPSLPAAPLSGGAAMFTKLTESPGEGDIILDWEREDQNRCPRGSNTCTRSQRWVGIWQGSRAGRPSAGDGKAVAKGTKVSGVAVVT